MDSEKPAAIRLSGNKILEEHCHFDNVDGKVIIQCMPDSITVCFPLLLLRSCFPSYVYVCSLDPDPSS